MIPISRNHFLISFLSSSFHRLLQHCPASLLFHPPRCLQSHRSLTADPHPQPDLQPIAPSHLRLSQHSPTSPRSNVLKMTPAFSVEHATLCTKNPIRTTTPSARPPPPYSLHAKLHQYSLLATPMTSTSRSFPIPLPCLPSTLSLHLSIVHHSVHLTARPLNLLSTSPAHQPSPQDPRHVTCIKELLFGLHLPSGSLV
jgi:hypothetical protein